MLGRSVEIWIASVFLILAVLAGLFWVPFDSETPTIYEHRRQTYIGDAMMPTIAVTGIAICAAIHLIMSWRRKPAHGEMLFDIQVGMFFALFLVIIAVSLTLMFWAGPIALMLFGPSGDEAVTYRQMRGTLPWKYIGYMLGGFTLVFGISCLLEGRMSLRRAASAIVAVIVLTLIFDIPFNHILLPPNGDF